MTWCYHRPFQARTFQGQRVCVCWLTAAAAIVGRILTGRLP